MVVPDSEMVPHGEVESPLRQDQHTKNHPFPSLGRQTSIYSLTLDEFQHTLSESGKNFGSMNMDEFLNSIWTAEEHQAQAQTHATTNDDYANMQLLPGGTPIEHKPIVKQLSLSRQGSLTLPAPLCRKTVDEVWSEIHRNQHEQQQNGGGGGSGSSSSNVQNPGTSQRQPTFGEMTLEDFLVKAGVVREQCNPPPPAQPPAYGVYPNNHHPGVVPSFSRPIMGGCGGGVSIPSYPSLPQAGESSMYNGERSRGYPQARQPPVNYGGRVGSGGGGYGQVQGMGMGSPVSPLSDGVGVGQPDGANQYGMEMGGMRGGRKRIIDGPVEKVVERRQRRMIKNRESAARSRARKQAYTVELEAELNQLKEENAQLKQALAELERKRKQQMWCNLMALFHAEYFEEAKMKSLTKAQRANERMRIMRRSLSCPL